jgi:uncharacterized protein YcfJ
VFPRLPVSPSAPAYPRCGGRPGDTWPLRRYRFIVEARRFATMKRLLNTSLAGALALAALPVAAQPWTPDAETYTARARVLSAVPIRERISAPREECWTEYRDSSGVNRAAGAAIGGIAGGVIGHQFGSGSGNTAATIAGALGGALVGNEIAERNRGGGRAVERCRTVGDYEERVVGYDVTYRFQGHEFSSRMPYDPGAELPVHVTVAPAR